MFGNGGEEGGARHTTRRIARDVILQHRTHPTSVLIRAFVLHTCLPYVCCVAVALLVVMIAVSLAVRRERPARRR